MTHEVGYCEITASGVWEKRDEFPPQWVFYRPGILDPQYVATRGKRGYTLRKIGFYKTTDVGTFTTFLAARTAVELML